MGRGPAWSDREDALLKDYASKGKSSMNASDALDGARSPDACRKRPSYIGHPFCPAMGGARPHGRPAIRTWETRLFEPWSEYTARRKAERAAKKAEAQERAA